MSICRTPCKDPFCPIHGTVLTDELVYRDWAQREDPFKPTDTSEEWNVELLAVPYPTEQSEKNAK
jgi:hypothetical protein